MVLLTYRHGLRASELSALRWEQVDLVHGLLHVTHVKNGMPSVHPLTGKELRALRRLQREQEPGRYVFMSERGAPMSPVGFRRMLERLGEAAKMAFGAHPHMLRHAAASSWQTRVSIRDRCSTTSATRTSNTPCATPSFPRTGSEASGRTD